MMKSVLPLKTTTTIPQAVIRKNENVLSVASHPFAARPEPRIRLRAERNWEKTPNEEKMRKRKLTTERTPLDLSKPCRMSITLPETAAGKTLTYSSSLASAVPFFKKTPAIEMTKRKNGNSERKAKKETEAASVAACFCLSCSRTCLT